jgi:predicted protein tyrosine phosphatase
MDAPTLKIEVASRLEAGEILRSHQRCAGLTYLVSIGDPYDDLPAGYHAFGRKLRLLIGDVLTEDGATDEDVRSIIALAECLRADTGTVLVHCEAGVSRSSAAALIMYACWLGPGCEREAMTRVLAQRPIAAPNRRMVQIGDRLLQREGRLLEALDEGRRSSLPVRGSSI